MSKIGIPGHVSTYNFREVDYALKCPLRAQFNLKMIYDLTPYFHRAMDQTINHFILRNTIGADVSANSLETMFESKLDELFGDKKPLNSELFETRMENGKNRFIKMLSTFHKGFKSIEEKYAVVHPSTLVEHISHGVTIEIYIAMCFKKVARGMGGVLNQSPPQYVILDYTEQMTRSVNVSSRIWATAIEKHLRERQVSTIGVTILNVPSMKAYRILPTSDGIGEAILESISKQLALQLVFPIFGSHCNSCLAQELCARSCQL